MPDALLVTTQDLLAARVRVAIAAPVRVAIAAHPDIDIASGPMPVVDGDADARAPVKPIALTVPSAIDVDVNVGVLPAAARALLAGAHVGAPFAALLLRSARTVAALVLCRARTVPALVLRSARTVAALAALTGLGAALSTILALSTRRVIALLCLMHEAMGAGCGGPGRERRDLVSTYKCERRSSGTQHQQVSHMNHPCSAFRYSRDFRSLPQQRRARKEVHVIDCRIAASATLAANTAGDGFVCARPLAPAARVAGVRR